MSGLRFCMLTTFYPPHNFGGDGIAIQRLARALVRRGHQVVVMHDVDAFNALHAGAEPAAESAADGVEVIGLRSGAGSLSPMLTHQLGRPVLNARRIRRVLDRDFDVTLFHNISLVGGPGILSAARGVSLYEAHEHWLVCPSHVLWRHNREACDSRECLRCVAHFHRPPQYWRYSGFLESQLQRVDAFIAKSEFSRRKHAEFGFRFPMRVVPYFLPDGPAPSAAVEATTARPQARPYFLFVGRLERIKGLDDVIPAFRRYPDADLLIAGEGTHGAALRALAGDAPNIRFLGRLPHAVLRQYYEHALALIVPSVGYETFGIILIEAFRQGTPVIARRIGPFPELVEQSRAGLLFTDVEEMLAHMRSLHTQPDLRTRLGAEGQASFGRMWTEQAVLPQYLDVIREVAERKGLKRVLEAIMETAA